MAESFVPRNSGIPPLHDGGNLGFALLVAFQKPVLRGSDRAHYQQGQNDGQQ